MSLHYLNSDDEPRECLPCKGLGRRRPRKGRGARICKDCHGTGRLGVEGKEPDVEIVSFGDSPAYTATVTGLGQIPGEYPTEAAALAAARAAHREGQK